MSIKIKIWFIVFTSYFLLLTSYCYAQENNHIFVERGSTKTLTWKAAGDYSAYDSLYFVVKPCTSNTCARLIQKPTSVSYSAPYTTMTCTLYVDETASFNAARYYYSIYAYGPDTVWVTSGNFNLMLNGQTPTDGVPTTSPYYTVALGHPLYNNTFIVGDHSDSTWNQKTTSQTRTILGIDTLSGNTTADLDSLYAIVDSLGANRTDSTAVAGIVRDSLDSYLQVGDWSTIVDEFPLATARLIYQPVGELNIYSAAISSILDLGFTSDAAALMIKDSLGAVGQDLLPKTNSVHDLGSSDKQWDSLHLAYSIIMRSGRGIATVTDGVFFLDLGGVSFRKYDGTSGGYVGFTGYTTYYNTTNPLKPTGGAHLYSLNGDLVIMDSDSNITNLTNPSFFDTVNVAVLGTMDTVTTGDYVGIEMPNNYTITKVSAYTNSGTVTFNIEERGETTPNTAGTDVMTSDLVADNDKQVTTTFSNADVIRNNYLTLVVTSITGDPTIFGVTVRGIKTN